MSVETRGGVGVTVHLYGYKKTYREGAPYAVVEIPGLDAPDAIIYLGHIYLLDPCCNVLDEGAARYWRTQPYIAT